MDARDDTLEIRDPTDYVLKILFKSLVAHEVVDCIQPLKRQNSKVKGQGYMPVVDAFDTLKRRTDPKTEETLACPTPVKSKDGMEWAAHRRE